MSEFTPTPEFEQKVRQALDVPAPSASFSNGLRARLIARSSEMNPQTSLRPTWRIAIAVLTALVFLLAVFNLPAVVTAMKNLLGYIPGVGPVSQNAPLRILAEPVSLTRDGYTLSVDNALASADETLIFYHISGIPAEAYYQGYDSQGSCRIQLRLPNGTQLDTQGGETNYGDGASQIDGKITFPPIPADVTEITLWMPCLDSLDHNKTPTDWELPLRLVPAPPELTVVPVIEVAPTFEITPPAADVPAVATATPAPSTATPAEIKLEQVVPAPGGTILVGSFALLDAPADIRLADWFSLTEGTVTDASGREFAFQPEPTGYGFLDLNDPALFIDAETPAWSGRWAIQIDGTEFTWPLTFTVRQVEAISRCAPVTFEFDTGPNSQVGQEWKLDQDLELCDGARVHLISIYRRNAQRIDITYTTDTPGLCHLPLKFDGYGNTGGGSGCEANGDCFTGVFYNDGAPSGKLTGVLTGELEVTLAGPWQVQWQP